MHIHSTICTAHVQIEERHEHKDLCNSCAVFAEQRYQYWKILAQDKLWCVFKEGTKQVLSQMLGYDPQANSASVWIILIRTCLAAALLSGLLDLLKHHGTVHTCTPWHPAAYHLNLGQVIFAWPWLCPACMTVHVVNIEWSISETRRQNGSDSVLYMS